MMSRFLEVFLVHIWTRFASTLAIFSAYCSFFRWTRHMDELWTWIICDTINCPLVHVSRPKGWTSLDICNWLIITAPRVIFSLANDSVNLCFQRRRHVSLSYWLGRFDYPGQHPINNGMPPLTLFIPEIFFFDIHRLEPRLGVSLRLESSSV